MAATVPRPGDYGVVRTTGFVPWVIRTATKSWADHAFVVADDGTLIEAEPGGVRSASLDEYAGCRIAFNTAEATTATQRAVVVTAAESMIGEPYNDLDLLNLGFEALGWHWRLLTRLAGDKGRLICSQLVAAAGGQAGLDWTCGKSSPAEVTPADLARRIDTLTPPVVPEQRDTSPQDRTHS